MMIKVYGIRQVPMTGVMAMWKTEMGAGGLSDLTSQKGNLHPRTACRDGTPFRGCL